MSKPIPVFVQIDAPGRMPGKHWQVSLYLDDGGNLTYPVAVAWLSDFTGSPVFDHCVLDFVLTPDHYRRQGLATALIAVCRSRWPNLVLTEAISPAGEGLAAAVEGGG